MKRKPVSHATIARQRGVVRRVRERLLRALRGIKKSPGRAENPRLTTIFHPVIDVVFKHYNLSPVAFSLLFFIEERFGLRFEKKQEDKPGRFYLTELGSWEKWTGEHIFDELEFNQLKKACEKWEVKDVPKSYREAICGNLSGHSFIDNFEGAQGPPEDSSVVKTQRQELAEALGEMPQIEKDKEVAKGYGGSTCTNFPAQLINFELLPTKKCTVADTITHYQRNQKYFEQRYGSQFDYDRIQKIFELNPLRRYWGRNAYLGYTALEFKDSNKVVLINPIYGNALYILRKSKWKEQTDKLKKEEIRNHYPSDSKRVFHRGDWFIRVKTELGNKSF